MRAPRGQSVVLTALIMLILVIAVFFTFTVGERVRQKTTAQAAADAVAYSTAVVEARAFNFFALSNRAMVSHTVAATSVMAHQSYLSFYEDALITAAVGYENIASRFKEQCGRGGQVCSCGNAATCQAAGRAANIGRLYAFGMPTLNGQVYDSNPNLGYATGFQVWVESGGGPAPRTVSGASSPAGNPLNLRGPRGALWFHDQYHAKFDGNWCGLMGEAMRDEYSTIQVLRAHQLDVHGEVQALLGNNNAKGVDVAAVHRELPRDGRKRTRDEPEPSPRFVDVNRFPRSLPNRSLADQLAVTFDKRLKARPASLNRTREAYLDALVSKNRPDLHRDYDQVLYATRYPDWVVQRTNMGMVEDANLRKLQRFARQLAGPDSVETIVRNIGNAGAMGRYEIPDGESHRSNETPWTGEPTERYLRPLSPTNAGKTAAKLLHDRDIQSLTSLGAEDRGHVTARYTIGSCGCTRTAHEAVEEGRVMVFNTGASGSSHIPGYHNFHGHTGHVYGHSVGRGDDFPLMHYAHMGHMRFRGRIGDSLLGMPRVVTELTRATRTAARPWDLKISAFAVQGEVNTRPDGIDNGEVAASAGALVYFHHPEDGPGPGSKEPPNLWSPFWRAKLHPLRSQDLNSPAINQLRGRAPLGEMLP